MNKKLIEYMIQSPTSSQMVSLRIFYSTLIKQLDSLQRFKNEESERIKTAYISNEPDLIQSMIINRTLIENELDCMNENLQLLENFLFKDSVIYVDLIETNKCPTCNKSISLEIMHYVLKDDSGNIIGRDYTKSCYCDKCKRKHITKNDYMRVINNHDINTTNIKINKMYCAPDCNIHTLIVLSNTKQCTHKEHRTYDILAKIPTINKNGNLDYVEMLVSYCAECNRFTMLKKDFNIIKDIIACKVIDETHEYTNQRPDEIEIEQRNSLLFNYGYNVQTKKDLSDKQRQMLLSSIIEAQIMDRREIINHLTTLIDRGSKIDKWKTATQKWVKDRDFVSNYELGSLPEVIFDNIILKYNKQPD